MAKTIFAKDPVKFIPVLAETLKGMEEFSVPEWASFVKSGSSRERPPVDENFWYTRAASILRQLYIHGVVGVGKLRTRYGSRKDRGGKASKFRKSGGKIIRVILQQAEEAGLVEKVTRLQYGRRLTAQGRDLLDSIEVEAKEDLKFDEVSTKPITTNLENLEELDSENRKGSDSENPEKLSSAGDLAVEEAIEEVTEVDEDKGEDVVEEAIEEKVVEEESKEEIKEDVENAE